MFICDRNYSCCNYQYWDRVEDVEQEAKECGHLIEVAPVRHGRWVWDDEDECWICSECKMSALNNYRGLSVDSPNCPNCGAKMDLGGDDNAKIY